MGRPESDRYRGMDQIAPGCYVDAGGTLHIDTAEMLRANGYPVTKENVAMLERAARDAGRSLPEVIDIEVLEHGE